MSCSWFATGALHLLHDVREPIEIALRLGRANAYDAAYIALVQSLGAELWTLDGPLVRNAARFGFPVHLLA